MVALAAAVVDTIESENFDEYRLEARDYRTTFLTKQNDGEEVVTTFYVKDARVLEWLCKPHYERPHTIRQHRLARNYHFFMGQIELLMEDNGREEGIEIAVEMVNALCDKSYLSVATFQSLAEAIHAFDTTNNRGQELTLTDLLRYWMLSNASRIDDATKEEVQRSWEIISELISKEVPRKDFVVRFWTGRLGERLTKMRLVSYLNRELKNNYKTKRKLKTLSRDLEDAARHYSHLINPPAGIPNTTNLKLFPNNAKQHLTTLLAGKIAGMPEVQFSRLLGMCEGVFVWYQLVSNRSGAALYHKYCEWGKLLLKSRNFDDTLDNIADDIDQFFTEKNLSSEDLEREFKRVSFDNNNQAKFLLSHYENKLNPDQTLESPSTIHLEHILPDEPRRDEWPGWTEDEFDTYTNRIGNMCLLLGTDNISVSNRSFEHKKTEAYHSTNLILTKELIQYDNWNPDNIKERQNRLYSLTKEIWDLSNL